MFYVFIMALGFSFQPPSKDCTEVIHHLREAHKLQIVSSVSVDETIVYTLSDRYGFKKKTVQIGCQVKRMD